MSNASKHTIHEQLLDLQFSSREAAEEWQSGASAFYHQRIVPLIDRYCSELCDSDTLIQIDELEIDLGEVSSHRFHLDLEEKVRQVFRSELESAIRGKGLQNQAQKEKLKTNSQVTLFDFFIRTGTLVWWSQKEDSDILQRSFRQIMRQDKKRWKAMLISYLQTENYVNRLLHYFSDTELIEMLSPFMWSDQNHFYDIIAELELLLDELLVKKQVSKFQKRKILWEGVFHAVLTEHSSLSQFVNRAVLHLIAAEKISKKAIAEVLQSSIAGFRILPEYLVDLHTAAVAPISVPAADRGIERIEQYQAEKFHQSDDLTIDNAGLVLLWPFLPRFFEHLELMENNVFVNELGPPKAMTILQYLVDGKTQPPEYLLPVNKLLCGLALDEVYPKTDIVLTQNDLELAKQFLEAILEHANPAIGKLSLEGFRNTFLQRPGLLGFEDGHWMLRVERETHDIVLDRLPWNFQILKLPWMEYALYVKW